MITDHRANGGRWDALTTDEKAEHRAWWVHVRRFQIEAAKRGSHGG